MKIARQTESVFFPGENYDTILLVGSEASLLHQIFDLGKKMKNYVTLSTEYCQDD